jgi:hypothetical protein
MSDIGNYLKPTVFGIVEDIPNPFYIRHAYHNMIGTRNLRPSPSTDKRRKEKDFEEAKTALLNLSNLKQKLERTILPNISMPKT